MSENPEEFVQAEEDVLAPAPELEDVELLEVSEKSEELPVVEAGPDLRGEPADEVDDLSYIDDVFDATTQVQAEKPKKVKIPVVPAVVNERFPAPVKVEALVFRARMKNSQSVRLVQQALNEQGYNEAAADVQGWLCEGTQAALARFQVEHGLVGSGAANDATVAALFDGSTTHYWER